MNKLELTKEHKDKLLEMTKKLFPEWDEIDVMEYDNFETIIMFTNYVGGSEWGQEIFHWFEFCILNICPKLTNCATMFDEIESNEIKITIHPIDYLYEQFKKLK